MDSDVSKMRIPDAISNGCAISNSISKDVLTVYELFLKQDYEDSKRFTLIDKVSQNKSYLNERGSVIN